MICKNHSGFIQIPLLIVIVVSILTASTGIGVVLYRENKLPFFNKRDNVIQTIQTSIPNLTPDPDSTQKPQPETLGTAKFVLSGRFERIKKRKILIPPLSSQQIMTSYGELSP